MGNNKYFGSIKPVFAIFTSFKLHKGFFESNRTEKNLFLLLALALVGTSLPSARSLHQK